MSDLCRKTHYWFCFFCILAIYWKTQDSLSSVFQARRGMFTLEGCDDLTALKAYDKKVTESKQIRRMMEIQDEVRENIGGVEDDERGTAAQKPVKLKCTLSPEEKLALAAETGEYDFSKPRVINLAKDELASEDSDDDSERDYWMDLLERELAARRAENQEEQMSQGDPEELSNETARKGDLRKAKKAMATQDEERNGTSAQDPDFSASWVAAPEMAQGAPSSPFWPPLNLMSARPPSPSSAHSVSSSDDEVMRVKGRGSE